MEWKKQRMNYLVDDINLMIYTGKIKVDLKRGSLNDDF